MSYDYYNPYLRIDVTNQEREKRLEEEIVVLREKIIYLKKLIRELGEWVEYE